jgi:signal peptidase I
MFGFFDSQEKKMRDNASNWLELASKVWNYRRDMLAVKESDELVSRMEELRRLMREKADAGEAEARDRVARGRPHEDGRRGLPQDVARRERGVPPRGGDRDPRDPHLLRPAVQDPDELDVADLLRDDGRDLPPGGPVAQRALQALRFVAYGAVGRAMVAPRDGQVSVPLFISSAGDRVTVAYTKKPGRKWLVIPAQVKEYTFTVDGEPATVQVPADFGESEFDDLVFNTFFPNTAALHAQIERARQAGQIEEVSQKLDESSSQVYLALRVPMGRMVHAGEAILRFDVLAGDQLFVDRVSYQFMRPAVGQGFVFRTDHIPEIERAYGDQYFVKRLIGVPGDSIELKEPILYRNGAPITGSKAFDLNAGRVSPYRGYFNATTTTRATAALPGRDDQGPGARYLALGDNSHDSFDGRFWGFVPEKDVVGGRSSSTSRSRGAGDRPGRPAQTRIFPHAYEQPSSVIAGLLSLTAVGAAAPSLRREGLRREGRRASPTTPPRSTRRSRRRAAPAAGRSSSRRAPTSRAPST